MNPRLPAYKAIISFTKMCGQTWTNSQPTQDFPHIQGPNAMVQWKTGVKRCQGTVWPTETHGKQHSARSNLQKSLMGPSFVEAERTRKYKKKKNYILDMVRVKPLSSSHTLSREFHASWTHFTRQHRAKNSFPFGPALKTHSLSCFKK